MKRALSCVFALDQFGLFGLFTAGARMARLRVTGVIACGFITAQRNCDLTTTAQLDKKRFFLVGQGACNHWQKGE